MANGTPDQQTSLTQAQDMLAQGSFTDAIQVLRTIIAAAPENGQALGMLGKAYLRTRDFDNAALSFSQAFACTGDARMLNWQGLALRKLRRRDEAEACYRQAIALAPGDPVPKANLALLIAEDSPPKGLAMLSEFYREQPSVEFLAQMVLICLRQKDYLNAGIALSKIPHAHRSQLNLTDHQYHTIFHNGALTAWNQLYCVESLILRRESWKILPIHWERADPIQDCPPPPPPLRYSRETPSPRYHILSEQYGLMHSNAAQSTEKVGDFAGTRMNFIYAPLIKDFLQAHQAASLLDYGGGRGLQYQPITEPNGSYFPGLASYYGVERAASFDAGWPVECPYPAGQQFDAVVSCDVLEHIDEADLPWVVDELFQFARKAIFVAIGSYPAVKILPNGENAHCTIKPSSWWRPLFAAAAQRYPGIHYRVLNVTRGDGAQFDGFEGIG